MYGTRFIGESTAETNRAFLPEPQMVGSGWEVRRPQFVSCLRAMLKIGLLSLLAVRLRRWRQFAKRCIGETLSTATWLDFQLAMRKPL